MVAVVINNFPAEISSDQFDIGVTVTGAKTGTNYLRVEIYKDGTTNYFGETFNGKDWYGASDGLQYFPIEINAASVSATIKARIGNPNNNEYLGLGDYKLKIKRYTTSGSAAANDNETSVNLKINYNLVTPTPNPTPTVLESTVVPTVIVLTSSPSPTVNVKSPKPEILGASRETDYITPTPIVLNEIKHTNSFSILPIIILVFGLILLLFGGYLFYTRSNAQKGT